MRQYVGWIAAISLCCVGAARCSSAVPDKYAVLIGVTKYEHARMNDPALRFPEADATAVRDLLEASDYDVELLLGAQATRTAVLAALNRAGTRGDSDGVVLIGLFGHGVQYDEDAYYCPYDTGLREVEDSLKNKLRDDQGRIKLEPHPETLVPMRATLDALAKCGAGNKVMLADCCREDPSQARGRAFGTNVTVSDFPPGTVAFFSCSESEQAFEHDDWGHGAFTFAFLEECKRRVPTGRVRASEVQQSVIDRVQRIVSEKTNGRSSQTVNVLSSGAVDLQLTRVLTSQPFEGSQPGELREDNGLKIQLRWCPPGRVAVSPQVTEAIPDGFWMGQYEVTRDQWLRVMETSPWRTLKNQKWVMQSRVKGQPDDFPAVGVSWLDAQEFCKRLTEREYSRLPAGVDYVLPSETQWVYACQAAVAPPSERTKSGFRTAVGASVLKDVAWHAANAFNLGQPYAHRVGLLQPNAWSFYDLQGNVWELCDGPADDAGNYPARGGGFYNPAEDCTPQSLIKVAADYQREGVGFRVCLARRKDADGNR